MISGTLGLADIISEERTEDLLTTLGEGRSRSQGEVALVSARGLLEFVTELKEAKERRVGVDTYSPSFGCQIEDAIYALERLVEYYEGRNAEIPHDRAAGIYADYVTFRLAELRRSAQEIDAELLED